MFCKVAATASTAGLATAAPSRICFYLIDKINGLLDATVGCIPMLSTTQRTGKPLVCAIGFHLVHWQAKDCLISAYRNEVAQSSVMQNVKDLLECAKRSEHAFMPWVLRLTFEVHIVLLLPQALDMLTAQLETAGANTTRLFSDPKVLQGLIKAHFLKGEVMRRNDLIKANGTNITMDNGQEVAISAKR
jgi:hypothetical protein